MSARHEGNDVRYIGFVLRGREKHSHQQGLVHWMQDPMDCSPFVLARRLWLRHHPLLRSGESMGTAPRSTVLQDRPSDRPDETRLALRRAVQATLAGFAEMDRLLDKAERLILCQRSGCAPQRMLTTLTGPVS
jgi:hypothetical protein